MKKIIKPAKKEEFILICDFCLEDITEWGSCSTVNFHFCYGSKRDMDMGQIDLCDACSEKILKHVQKKAPSFKLKEYCP